MRSHAKFFFIPTLLLTICAAAVSSARGQCPTWTLRSPTHHPVGGSGRQMAYDSDRSVTVEFGGSNGNPNSETWEYDGTDWTQKSPAHAPLPTEYSSMAYDANRHVTVLFGGSAFDPMTGMYNSDETWEWNGTDWTKRTPTTSPPGRVYPALVYDSNRHVCVLFGGFQFGPTLNLGDTWEYDGTTWTHKTPAHSPDPRDGHAMAFDSVRGVTVLFGGQTFVTSNDTWEWDGTDWTQRNPSHPPTVRRDMVMGFDVMRGQTIMFGGTAPGFVQSSLTMAWDGVDWEVLLPVTSPIGRDGAAMDYDSARHVIVMFGGNNLGELVDTYELSPHSSSEPAIGTEPLNASHCAGETASFSVVATGLNLSYQWRVSTNGGSTFNNVSTGSGGTTDSYTTGTLAPTDNGNLYQCLVTGDCGSRTSTNATLTVNANTSITTQPGNATAVVITGSPAPTASFTVVAAGSGLSYQWEQSKIAGTAFTPVTTGTGGTSATYHTAELSLADNGTLYHCVVTGQCGSDTSEAATISVQQQTLSNTSTVTDTNGDSITITSPNGTGLTGVVAQGNPSPNDTPAGAQFPIGFLSFHVTGVSAGGSTTVQITLPSGVNATTYWKYGPGPGNTTSHWYEFSYDGTTGAEINGNVITLHFVDGARGDADLTANGVIVDPGAPATVDSGGGSTTPTTPAGSSTCGTCGSGAGAMMPFGLMLLGARNRNRRRRVRESGPVR